jgi:hypothetical protein
MVVMCVADSVEVDKSFARDAETQDYYWSLLNPDSYRVHDEATFKGVFCRLGILRP